MWGQVSDLSSGAKLHSGLKGANNRALFSLGIVSLPIVLDPIRFELYSLNNRTGELTMLRTAKPDAIVVSALHARANFGRLLQRVSDERRSLVIEKRGTPKAVLMSIRDYVRLAAPEPEVLRLIGEESQRKGTSKLSERQIDQIIKTTRAQKSKRR